MLMTKGVDLSTSSLVSAGKKCIINEIGNKNVDGAKVGTKKAKSKSQDKSKSKNLVNSFLAKSQAFAQGFGLGFITLEAKQVFTKLRQDFIKVPIFHYFDSDYHIWIEINKSNYSISGVLS